MLKTVTGNNNFTNANDAVVADDYRKFSRAITSEKRVDPIGARDIAELAILKVVREAGTAGSPATRMMTKAIDVLMELAPILSFDTDEKALTLRALSVAEAACVWSTENTLLQKVEAARSNVESMSPKIAFRAAIKAGIIDIKGRETGNVLRPAIA